MEAVLAESGLVEFLCRPPHENDREAALRAAVRACLDVPGARRAWARLRSRSVELSGDGDPREGAAFGLEIPVEVGGDVCGTVGVEADESVNGSAHRRAVAVAELLSTLEARRCLADESEEAAIVGCSDAIRRAEATAHRFARLEEPVLLLGETGVGKELMARTIHCLSRRRREPICAVNCAAVPEELLASELFGHRRGAFTGAVKPQRGRFEVADGATLFLDEIGDMGPRLQAALLRVIEYGEIQQLGDEGRTRRVDVRVVAATNHDLAAEVEAGRFRSDLFYRLSALTLRVPPLRQRAGDIPVLARYFVDRLSRRWGRRLEISSAALEQLMTYRFPGNVRELRNLVLRAAATSVEGRIERIELPPRPPEGADEERGPTTSPRPVHKAPTLPRRLRARVPRPNARHGGSDGGGRDDLSLEAATAAHLERVLGMAGGNVSRAARILDIPRTTLQSKLRRYGVAS